MSDSSATDTRFPVLVADRDWSCGLLLEFLRRGWCARRVRGRKMESVDQLFDEVSAAFQFPWYFGENWPAFDECINDLEWLEWKAGFAVVVADADRVLLRDVGEQLRAFVEIMHDAIQEWADSDRDQWAKPEPINNVVPTPLTFRLVLQTSRRRYRSCRKRWEDAGAVLYQLDEAQWSDSKIFDPTIERQRGHP